MTRRLLTSLALAGAMLQAMLLASCGGGAKKQLVVAFSQANNAEFVLRSAPFSARDWARAISQGRAI